MTKQLAAALDVETTGLDERPVQRSWLRTSRQQDELLEIAAVVIDSDYNKVDKGIIVIIQPENLDATIAKMDDFVLKMHTKSGLIDELRAGGGESRAEADALVTEYLQAHGEKLPMAGNSMTLDRNFLREFAPNTLEALHYRSIDLTSVKNFLDNEGIDITPFIGKQRHRGMDDLEDMLGSALHYREALHAWKAQP